MSIHLADDARTVIFQKSSALISYLFSGGLVLGEFLEILDRYSGAFGVIIAGITCATNLYFHLKKQKEGDDQ